MAVVVQVLVEVDGTEQVARGRVCDPAALRALGEPSPAVDELWAKVSRRVRGVSVGLQLARRVKPLELGRHVLRLHAELEDHVGAEQE